MYVCMYTHPNPHIIDIIGILLDKIWLPSDMTHILYTPVKYIQMLLLTSDINYTL